MHFLRLGHANIIEILFLLNKYTYETTIVLTFPTAPLLAYFGFS